MRKITLVLAVVFIFLLVTPTLAQQWQTFYLTPSDPHWVRKEDPTKSMTEQYDSWIVNSRDADDPSPRIYFQIPELSEYGGYIKFWYAAKGGWNRLTLYASKDGTKYVKLWGKAMLGFVGKTGAIVEIPPGYKYFLFYLEDGFSDKESIILYKEIQFKTKTSIPFPTHTPQPQPQPQSQSPRLGTEGSGFLIVCIAIAVATLTTTRLKKV